MGKLVPLSFGELRQAADKGAKQAGGFGSSAGGFADKLKTNFNKGAQAVNNGRSAGSALPPSVRHLFEAQFNQSLGDIRIHENHLPTLAGARSFAQGQDIHFAPGQYDPHSQAGRELLGHELAHVVQRKAGLQAIPNGMSEILDAADLGQKS